MSYYSKHIPFVPTQQSQSSSQPPHQPDTHSVADFYSALLSTSTVSQSQHPPPPPTIWCPACELHVPVSSYERHLRGTTHLVSKTSEAPIPDVLTLNEANRGFQMLRAQGWEYDQGLGADGQGRRHPISTRLKNDRLGLGAKRNKRVVTHSHYEIVNTPTRSTLPEVKKPNRREIVAREKRDREERLAMIAYMNR
ncbi:hypothetical protein BC936DRAFT_148164 [Jimgerdemannia flammicorona]|uniref:G-patch domain-containing protein n=1 Tax=Jimgerdemannia flammicorona TaxID=994334 RepID=A0A433D3M9_9FUNG|nr:hypothetical protein BC936DRAFT_148164 [Jimgerdemannia flammicorona]